MVPLATWQPSIEFSFGHARARLTLRFGRPAPAPPEKPALVAKYTKEQRRALESFASDDLLSVPELPVPSCVADQPDAREAALLRYRQLAALPQPAAAQ